MTDKILRKKISDMNENSIFFDEPSYDGSIIGVTTDGNVIYDLNLMAREFARESQCSLEEAYDFIMTNTVKALPYIGEHLRPIIKQNILL